MYELASTFRTKQGLENSPGNVFVNINKETNELYNAIEADNEWCIVDELCDHVIYPINIIEALGGDSKLSIESLNLKDSPILDCNDITPKMAVSCIMMALADWNLYRDIKALALIARIALKALHSLGYNSEFCVIEKFKCINSRDGSYNMLTDKWEKDVDQCPDTIYQPQYDQCKKEPLCFT